MRKAATTPSNNLYLVVGYGPNGPVLTVSKTKVTDSAIAITRNDYLEFRFYMLQIIVIKKIGKIRTKNENVANIPYEKIAQNIDVFKELVFWFYADIARLVAPECHSESEQIEKTALALYPNDDAIPFAYYARVVTGKKTPVGCYLFNISITQRVAASDLHQQLLNLTLNAVEELDKIQCIVNSTRPEDLPILLNTPSTATITHLQHLNIERTGTPLQMALYGGDEDIVAYLKKIMDPEEFERQSKAVFRNALSTEIRETINENIFALEHYNAMLIVQKTEAKKLCNEAFQCRVVDGKPQFTITDATVADFQQKLTNYVKNNSMHNPFILYWLYEIYKKLPYIWAEDCLFLEKAIGLANALSSARWLQHCINTIYFTDGCNNDTPKKTRRSFLYYDVRYSLNDIRSFIPKQLGVDSFLCISNGRLMRAQELARARFCVDNSLEIFVKQKTASFLELIAHPVRAPSVSTTETVAPVQPCSPAS